MAFALLTACNNTENEVAKMLLPEIDNPEAYLFTYFTGGKEENQEALRFAVSEDAVNWHALNGGEPVVPSSEISNTGGIRDPHILRGANGSGYYIVATDMNTFKNGWGPNPGIVMLHSDDLVNWTSSAIDFTKTYPEYFGDVERVWAPQTVYDAGVDKYLVYFTIGFRDRSKPNSVFFCAYANKDFTGFEAMPELMWAPEHGAIDGDIVADPEGLLHFFSKGNIPGDTPRSGKSGIRQATSASLQGPWVEAEGFVDAYCDTPTNVEGSGIFKLNPKDCKNGETEYILMYDLYTSGRYEFQRSNDLWNFTSEPESFTKDFAPRHGTVMPISREELERLEAAF